MKEYFNQKKLKKFLGVGVLLVVLMLLIKIVPFTRSRYQTEVTAVTELDAAIYLLDPSYQTLNIKLDDVLPGNTKRYTFSVANYKEEEHSEVDLEYNLTIRATTNLPISYRLINSLNADTGTNIIQTDNTQADGYGTYFRTLTTTKTTMDYDEDEIKYYTLEFSFPSTYNDYNYSRVLEYIEIIIESQQVINS